jgi:hypothetical protein
MCLRYFHNNLRNHHSLKYPVANLDLSRAPMEMSLCLAFGFRNIGNFITKGLSRLQSSSIKFDWYAMKHGFKPKTPAEH